ncbi:MAG: hypothetical protein IKQ30_01190 [Bacteroidales bacterium]|nr:hypothetical protein [Bacteroidales bacterium]
MKKYIIALGVAALATVANAQNEYDALRFSQTFQQGTARSAAMGGAFGALGGDISVTAINPAGMSIYRGADICLTPMVYNNTVKSTINGRDDEDSKFGMKFASIGIVMGNDRGKTTGFTNFAWGITYNRLNDFSSNERLGAFNNSSSMLDRWKDMGSQEIWSDYTNELGYKSGLLDRRDDKLVSVHDKDYHSDYSGGYGEYQSRSVTQKGGVGTWDFAISGAFNDMFFFGASLGVQSINYKYTSRYHEDDKDNLLPYEYWDYAEKLKINGGGINLKLGLVVKPINFLRFGAAFHTPTVYNLTDKYYTNLKRVFDPDVCDDLRVLYNQNPSDAINPDELEFISPNDTYEYDLVTPMKGILSAAFIVPGYGLVSFDYESVNYTKAKFQNDDFDDDDFTVQNDAIKEKFQKTNNFRVGLEGLAGPVSIRAGYALYGNPYKFVSGNKQRQILSFGLGLKGTEDFYIDLTATYHIYQTDAVLYEWADRNQMYNYDNRYFNVLLTFGVRL